MPTWQSLPQTFSRPQWDAEKAQHNSLLSTLELGTLGIGLVGLAETLPMLLDLCGQVHIFTAMGLTDLFTN